MTGSTVRGLLSRATWRRLWDRFGEVEEAISLTEGDIHERRISRLEVTMAELRAHAGLAVRTASPSMPEATSRRP